MSNDFYVYVHRKATTNEVFYVGRGKNKRAWVTRRSNKFWQNTVAKYGHIVEVVLSDLTLDQANTLEIDLIDHYGITNLTNMTLGGDWGALTGIALEKMRNSLLGRKLSIEHRSKIGLGLSKSKKGKPLSQKSLDVLRSKEVKDKRSASRVITLQDSKIKEAWSLSISKAKKGKPLSEKNLLTLRQTKAKPVLCIESGNTFYAISDAVTWLKSIGENKAAASNIVKTCRGKRKSCYGFTWRYA